jgi:AcrR family transcriptional regulator
MENYSKGESSREEIINKSREIFNEYGIQTTLSNLAELMETTLGRITHHFKNKDLLFVAIAEDYEKKLKELRQNRTSGPLSMHSFIEICSEVFDLQYDYRCAMRFIVASFQHQKELKSHIHDAYGKSRASIEHTITTLIDSGLLQQKILRDGTFDVFLFQFTNLFTNWVINLELYDNDKAIQEVKPVYLKGILSVFIPYLTQKGHDQLYQHELFRSSD